MKKLILLAFFAIITVGHARMTTTTDIYLHSDERGAKKAIEAVADAILLNCSPYCSLSGEKEGRVQ